LVLLEEAQSSCLQPASLVRRKHVPTHDLVNNIASRQRRSQSQSTLSAVD